MTAIVESTQIRGLIGLQLAGAAIGQKGMISVKHLFSNIKRYTDLDIDFPTFLSMLEEVRSEFKIRDGEIGVDVNYLSL